jgi:hypothetical protein
MTTVEPGLKNVFMNYVKGAKNEDAFRRVVQIYIQKFNTNVNAKIKSILAGTKYSNINTQQKLLQRLALQTSQVAENAKRVGMPQPQLNQTTKSIKVLLNGLKGTLKPDNIQSNIRIKANLGTYNKNKVNQILKNNYNSTNAAFTKEIRRVLNISSNANKRKAELNALLKEGNLTKVKSTIKNNLNRQILKELLKDSPNKNKILTSLGMVTPVLPIPRMPPPPSQKPVASIDPFASVPPLVVQQPEPTLNNSLERARAFVNTQLYPKYNSGSKSFLAYNNARLRQLILLQPKNVRNRIRNVLNKHQNQNFAKSLVSKLPIG